MNAHTREPFHIRILKGLLGIIWSIDWPLMVIVLILSAWGFVALYSAGYSFPWRIDGQIRNLAAAGAAMMLLRRCRSNGQEIWPRRHMSSDW